MPCPVCNRTMQNLGSPERRIFWCASCGTLKEYTGDFERVELPGDLRELIRVSGVRSREPGVMAIAVVEVSYFVGQVDGQQHMVDMIIHSPGGNPIF